MNRLRCLKERKSKLILILRLLDKDASLNTLPGRQYTHVLAKLVLIQFEIDRIEKEKAAQ